MNNTLPQRDAFWNALFEIAKQNSDVVVVSADMGAPSLDKFRKVLPGQYVAVGIAEQNATLIASGLALVGKKVFTYAIAPFITIRCLEQIRVESSIMNIPITIVGVGAGFGYPDSGPTHHITEDIAIMRTMPNITVNNVTDSVMARALAQISCDMNSTNYVRLDRETLPTIYPDGTSFTDGVHVFSKSASGYYIIATGAMTHPAFEVKEALNNVGIDVGIIDIYNFPINKDKLLESINGAKKLITLEEHFLPGGLGSEVLEILNDNNRSIPVLRIGLEIEKGFSYVYGGRELIRQHYGIDTKNIVERTKNYLSANLK